MYTQVSFGQFLERLFSQAKAERGIEFDEYPNPAVSSSDGDWLYEIDNGFRVRIFRWPPQRIGKRRWRVLIGTTYERRGKNSKRGLKTISGRP